jgi:hypothetical protein
MSMSYNFAKHNLKEKKQNNDMNIRILPPQRKLWAILIIFVPTAKNKCNKCEVSIRIYKE